MSRELERRLARLKRKGWTVDRDEPLAGGGHRIAMSRLVIVEALPVKAIPNVVTGRKIRGTPRDRALRHALEDAERS